MPAGKGVGAGVVGELECRDPDSITTYSCREVGDGVN